MALSKLKVFLSYSGKDKHIWNPFKRLIEQGYQCKVIWGEDEAVHFASPEAMMEEMVRKSDVEIFLLTDQRDGVFEEMRLWYAYNLGQFKNCMLLKDPAIPHDLVQEKVGFNPSYTRLNSQDPWSNLDTALLAVHKFIMRNGLLNDKLPLWRRRFNKILHFYSWKIDDDKIPVQLIERLFEKIASLKKYEDPELWNFRINWHIYSPNMDSYSNKINCMDLLESILQTGASRHECEYIFNAIDRAITANTEPPRKLSGTLLFSGCSISTRTSAQEKLGNHPYEKRDGFTRKRVQHSERVPDRPEALLLPKPILSYDKNFETFTSSQKLILSSVSKICKYVLSSTVEITVSHSMCMKKENGHDFLIMACTATRTDKGSLAAIAEIPVVTLENGTHVWYGQPYKKPTSEYLPHWIYHTKNGKDKVDKNVIIHFHPDEMVDMYRRIYDLEIPDVTLIDFIQNVELCFRGMGIDFHVFHDFRDISSRDPEFGIFMKNHIEDDRGDFSVIWKPNHGIWVFMKEPLCSDEYLIKRLLDLDSICHRACRMGYPER